MPIPGHRLVTRRDLLKYGVAGSAAVLLGPLAARSASASPNRLRAARTFNPAIQRGGTLHFARSIGPTTLDPANTIIAGDIYTLDKILEPLYLTNPAGQLVPWLATGYEVSSDHKTFTFALRPGVKFSNGKPLVADDVVFSINRSRKDSAGPLSFLDYAITDISAKGTGSVVFQLSQPWAPFLSDISVFANAILPANFGGQSEKDFFDCSHRHRPVHARGVVHTRRQLIDLESQPQLLAGRQALPGRRRVPVRGQRQPAGAADPGGPGRHHRHRASRQRFLAQGQQRPERRPLPCLAGRPAGHERDACPSSPTATSGGP